MITDDHPSYRRFATWWDTSGGHGCTKASCLKCNSDTQTPDVRPQPADLRECLQAAYPEADVDELLAKAKMTQ